MSTTQTPPVGIAPPARGLAITALVLGIVAVLTAAVPVLGTVLGIVGIVFGVIAMKKKQPKGLSLTGLILSIVATVISIIVTIMLGALAGAFFGALEETSSEDGTVSQAETSFGEDMLSDEGVTLLDGPIPWDAFNTADAPVSTHAGTEEDPHPIGSSFTLEGWEVVVDMVDLDATEQILALAPEDVPPADDERYVLLNVTVNNPTGQAAPVPSNVGLDYLVPGRALKAGANFKMVTPSPVLYDLDRQITGSYTGYVAFRSKDVDGEALRFSS